ncbi:hypothetical protein AA14362_2165 [Acetobacter cerevisiae DSM 14362]|nr:hypothetical protein AA14362_2165 [Acetobacter cerevisiae DSM 14362]
MCPASDSGPKAPGKKREAKGQKTGETSWKHHSCLKGGPRSHARPNQTTPSSVPASHKSEDEHSPAAEHKKGGVVSDTAFFEACFNTLPSGEAGQKAAPPSGPTVLAIRVTTTNCRTQNITERRTAVR